MPSPACARNGWSLGNGASSANPALLVSSQKSVSIIMLTMEEAMKQSQMRFAAGEIVKGIVIEVESLIEIQELKVDILGTHLFVLLTGLVEQFIGKVTANDFSSAFCIFIK